MIAGFELATVAAFVLAAVVLIGAVGILRARCGAATALALIASQAALAYATHRLLFPPAEVRPSATITVLTDGAGVAAVGRSTRVVAVPGPGGALPEPLGAVEVMPDLATVLRRHPDVRTIEVIGNGLTARDRDAARAVSVRYDDPTMPRGLVSLSWDARVAPGRVVSVQGIVDRMPGARLSLRTGDGEIVASATPSADGGMFLMQAPVKGAGRVRYALRIEQGASPAARSADAGADPAAAETLAIPVDVAAQPSLRLAVLGGSVHPELKYFRRWAVDAGYRLDATLGVSRDRAFSDGELALDAAALADLDLIMIDERAWAALAPAQHDALAAAVRDGLGLLLRVTGPLPDPVRAQWQAFGFTLTDVGDEVPREFTMQRTVAAGNATHDAALRHLRLPIAATGDGVAPLLVADDARAIAAYRLVGEGRIGVAWWADSFRVALAGRPHEFGAWWAPVIETLARARNAAPIDVPSIAYLDERASICGIGDGAQLIAPDGTATALAVVAREDGIRCAAAWPSATGWHEVRDGGRHAAFDVADADAAPSLRAAERVGATRAMALRDGNVDAAPATHESTWPRWAVFLVWLAVATVLWWLERQTKR